MAGCQNDRTSESLAGICFDTYYLFFLDDEGIHASLEMHFATTFDNGVSHVLDDTRKFVCTDMRMCID